MYNIQLQWREFNVNLPDVRTWINANMTPECYGLSADDKLTVHLASEPSTLEKATLATYWAALTSGSSEVTDYKSLEQIEADKAAKIVSAKAKLIGLGLSEAEANAVLGL